MEAVDDQPLRAGQTEGAHAFSVAQHCVVVERLVHELRPKAARQLRLAALLHDAAEYVPTRAFYQARGFLPAKTFPGWWEADLPLLLVRPL